MQLDVILAELYCVTKTKLSLKFPQDQFLNFVLYNQASVRGYLILYLQPKVFKVYNILDN